MKRVGRSTKEVCVCVWEFTGREGVGVLRKRRWEYKGKGGCGRST